MLKEQSLNTNLNSLTEGIDTDVLTTFINELSYEIEGFTYNKEDLISEIKQLYKQSFNESTVCMNDHNKLIFPIANNSAFLTIEYKLALGIKEFNVITVIDVYVD
jgi:hypothetical protein